MQSQTLFYTLSGWMSKHGKTLHVGKICQFLLILFPVMTFLNVVFIRDLWALYWVSSDSIFCLVFYRSFSVLQNTIHKYTRGFFLRKWQEEVKSAIWIAWSKSQFFRQIVVQEFLFRIRENLKFKSVLRGGVGVGLKIKHKVKFLLNREV